MVLNYSLRNEDMLVYSKMILKKKSLFSKPYVLIILGVVICNLIFFRDPNGVTKTHFYILLIIFILIIVSFVLLIRHSSLNQFKKNIRRNPSLIGERKLEIVNDKIILSTDNSISKFMVKGLKKVEEAEEYYYIYTDCQLVIILPKRAQGSDQFIRELNETMKINVC